MKKIKTNEKLGDISVKIDSSEKPKYVLLLAHGAGAGINNKFLDDIALGIASKHGIVIRFNFPYMEQGKKLPGSPKPNISAVGALVSYAKQKYPKIPILLSGKSYGGRISSHWLEQNQNNDISGIIYIGFPLHAPGQESKERAKHLYNIQTPQLFIQGSRDALATPSLIKEVINDCPNASSLFIDLADHSFKVPKKASDLNSEEVMAKIINKADQWILNLL